MRLIVWLGNPGPKYAKTRHNAGFLALDFLREKLDFPEFTKEGKLKGEVSEGVFQGQKVLLLKPTTFMNLSWESIAPMIQFYKIDSKKDLLVISDDIDQVFGNFRMREKGSSGGQNGIQSIIDRIGHSDFPRIKIGIWRHEHRSPADWVLSRFTDEEFWALQGEVIPEVTKRVTTWLS